MKIGKLPIQQCPIFGFWTLMSSYLPSSCLLLLVIQNRQGAGALCYYEIGMLKIIIIIIGYTLNNFTTHITITVVDDGKKFLI
jgi:hypothetical protein